MPHANPLAFYAKQAKKRLYFAVIAKDDLGASPNETPPFRRIQGGTTLLFASETEAIAAMSAGVISVL